MTDTVTRKYDSNGNLIEALYQNDDGSSVDDFFDPTHGDQMYQQNIVNADKTSIQKTFDVTGASWTDKITFYNASGVKTEARQDNDDGSSTDTFYTSTGAVSQLNTVAANKTSVQTTYNTGTGNWKDIIKTFNASNQLTETRYDNNDGSSIDDFYTTSGALSQQNIVNADKTSIQKTFDTGTNTWTDKITFYNASGVKTEARQDNDDGSSTDTFYTSTGAVSQLNTVAANKTSVQETFNTGSGNWKDIIKTFNASGVQTEVRYDNNDGSSIDDFYTTSGVLSQQNIVNADKTSIQKTFDTGSNSWTDKITFYNASGVKTEARQDNDDGSSTDAFYTSTGAVSQLNTVAANKTSVQTTYNTGTGNWKDIIKTFNASGVQTEVRYDNNDGSSIDDLYTTSGALSQQNIVNADKTSIQKTFDTGSNTWTDKITFYNASGSKIETRQDNDDGSSVDTFYVGGGLVSQINTVNADQSSVQETFNTSSGNWKDIIKTFNTSNQLIETRYDNNDGSSIDDFYTTGGVLSQQNIVNADKTSEQKVIDTGSNSWTDKITFYNASGVKTEFRQDNDDGSSVDAFYDPTHNDNIYQVNLVHADKSSVEITYNLGTGNWKDIVKTFDTSGNLTEARYDNNDGSSVDDYYNSKGVLYQQLIVGANSITTIKGSSGNDTLTAGAGNTSLVGAGGADVYAFGSAFGQDTINNQASGNTTAHGTVSLGAGISDQKLWFVQAGNDLQIDLLGTSDKITIAGWFSGNAGAQVQTITTSDGLKLDSQVAQLVSAMASYVASNTGFNPSTATSMPTDSTLQAVIAAAWHK